MKHQNTPPHKGEYIKIIARKCGNLQKHIKVGSSFVVQESSIENGIVYVTVSNSKTKRGTMRINSSRFDWNVVTEKDLAEEKFKEECHNDAVALTTDFSQEEQLQIAVVPLIYNHIAWHFAMKAVELSVKYRVEILKKLTRSVRELDRQYDRFLRTDLDSLHIKNLQSQSDEFIGSCASDLTIFYFTVNSEFKKKMPTYPYDDLRTFAIMSVCFIREAEAHNKRMDDMIRKRLGHCKETINNPIMMSLKTCMEAFAGEVGKFDYNEQNVQLCLRIFRNNMKRIEFCFS